MTGRILAVSGVCLFLLVWTHARPRAADVPRIDFAAAVPLVFGEWVGRDAPPLGRDVAAVLAADQYVHRYYAVADRASRVADVEIDIAYYAQPQAGAAMHSPLNCLPGNGWQVVESRVTPVSHDGGTANVRQLVVARGSDRVAMTYWFQNRGAIVGNEYRQRVQLLTNGLHGRPTDAALVRVMALDTRDGRAMMHRFSRQLASVLSVAFR